MFEDIILVKGILDGHVEKFNNLIEKYEKIVFMIVYRFVCDKKLCEEICKEIFVEVYNNLYKYNNNCKFSNWVFRITLCKCKRYIEKDFIKNNKILSSLDCNDKCIILLKSINENFTCKDISEVLEINETSIKERYRKTMIAYKNALKGVAL
ncbi:hypothetical protein GCM10008905_11660 [Clostridium malenominatum]|uniref:RNA polymerase sigma-70 region 2 domain-containing protein n=1 Tax=Clostridium malenominatum TaxID=1539 RepID=A0ABP3U1N3_9CLOT